MPGNQTVGNMTLDELEAFVQEIIRRKAAEQSQPEHVIETKRSLEEIFASIDKNMIVLPPDAKSSLELLREDRQR